MTLDELLFLKKILEKDLEASPSNIEIKDALWNVEREINLKIMDVRKSVIDDPNGKTKVEGK